ncbi:MAG: hypothetical protein JWP76_1710 [Dactylosporangium sp.]|nr:hypothetical protein [Dactylosporangium sp.]
MFQRLMAAGWRPPRVNLFGRRALASLAGVALLTVAGTVFGLTHLRHRMPLHGTAAAASCLPADRSGTTGHRATPAGVSVRGDALVAGSAASTHFAQNATRPVLAVVGASVAAGVGASRPSAAWPAALGRMLNWRVEVSADPGAGYVNPGAGHRGPFAALADRLDLARLQPTVVLIQGGHNDIGEPITKINQSVRRLIGQIHCETPHTRVGLVTVFATSDTPSRADLITDQAIVKAARQTDPHVMVFDPIAEHWRFPRVPDQLHPTTAGHQWIATRLTADLHAAGIPRTALLP